MSMVRPFTYSLLLLAFAIPSWAQNACELTLTKAQEEFDAGRFHGVPALLNDCLQKNQNREWRQRAYLLLAETYLLLQDNDKADESYLNVLRANPEFVTDETRDPIDLVYLSRKFTATPIFSLSAKIGLNTSMMRVIHDVDISQNNLDLNQNETGVKPIDEKYSLKAGWQGALGLEYHYRENFSLAAEVMYSFTSFTYTSRNLFKEGNYSLEFTDKQTWMSIPVSVKYTHGQRALRPFASLGYSVNLLLRDRADMVIDGDKESEVFNYDYKRPKLHTAVVAGVGLKYKWGLRYIFGEVRYSLGMSNLTDPEHRWDNFDGINQSWPYVDDDFRMDNVYLSIGYVHPFYKARKLKKARTSSVLRKTNND
jgi:hypothetical protein